ncbi:MAG TPA: dialkylresorcinol condensing enzyme [Porticoccus sp.]|nr:dialkylresorcinol condensing enzyme [Porticoccus sp.]
MHSITGPLSQSDDVEVVYERLRPLTPYPFPWPFLTFFDSFPETVYDDPRPIEPLSEQAKGDFDLIIVAYQVWFLSPSQPVTAFLQSADAEQLLRDKPVVTVIACRNMWLMAQEKMKQHLNRLGARLIDNVVLTDPGHSAATFLSTPLWVLTGNKGPFLNGLIPKAGVSADDIEQAKRFGEAIARQLPDRTVDDNSPMLQDLGAVAVNDRLIASEKVGSRSFHIWGGLLRATGKAGTPLRSTVLIFYIVFLITLILTVVPITAVIKRLMAPLMKRHITQQHQYFSAPSGDNFSTMHSSNEHIQ